MYLYAYKPVGKSEEKLLYQRFSKFKDMVQRFNSLGGFKGRYNKRPIGVV